MNPTTVPLLIAALLALASLLALLRLFRQRHRHGRARLVALLLAQPLLATLLYLGLYPPLRSVAAGTMTVLTAGASPAAARGALRITLPEAPASADAEPMPDLATALRLHPQTGRLQILGSGLEARDLAAARTLPLSFAPAAPVAGIIELQAPTQVAAGNSFHLRGRIAGIPSAQLELLDPAGQRAQRTTIDAQGHFHLQGNTRSAGLATFLLRIADHAGRLRETLPLPLQVEAPAQPRVLFLAGAPTPELKYLRRWAVDAGIRLHSRISTGGGIALGDPAIALDATTLRRFDVVLLDLRSLRALGSGELAALTAAVRDGLGLLLRVDEPLQASDRARLRSWGALPGIGTATQDVQLAGDATLPALSRRDLRLAATDSVPLLRDAHGHPLAAWQALGRGRIALLALGESYPLVLAGHAARHAQLWSSLLASIARPRDDTPLPAPSLPLWPDQRTSFCGLGDAATVQAPNGGHIPLPVDPATGSRRCAAFWPRQAGWHVLQSGTAQQPFAVLPADAGAALRAQRRRDATLALAAQQAATASQQAASQRGPSWPWLIAWLALAALTWWLERRRMPDAAAAVSPATAT